MRALGIGIGLILLLAIGCQGAPVHDDPSWMVQGTEYMSNSSTLASPSETQGTLDKATSLVNQYKVVSYVFGSILLIVFIILLMKAISRYFQKYQQHVNLQQLEDVNAAHLRRTAAREIQDDAPTTSLV